MILDYLKLHIDLTVKYLNILPQLYKDYSKGATNQDAMLIDDRVALAYCLYEIIDTFIKIIGYYDRLQFYSNNYLELEKIDSKTIC